MLTYRCVTLACLVYSFYLGSVVSTSRLEEDVRSHSAIVTLVQSI